MNIETASKQMRIYPRTQPVLNHIAARINVQRLKKGKPELTKAEIVDLAVRHLDVQTGVDV